MSLILDIEELSNEEREKINEDMTIKIENKMSFIPPRSFYLPEILNDKIYLPFAYSVNVLNKKRISDLVLVRSAVESSDSKLGFLPGDIMDKFNVYLTPFHDKFSELLNKSQVDRLQKDNRITICPINFARGLHFSAKFVCADEIQNFSKREIHTIMSRIGEFSKVFLCGDPEQSDLPAGKSGFNKVYDLFNNEEGREHGIFCMELTEEDIVRSELCRYITHKFKELQTNEQPKYDWKPSEGK
jgi:phosphate starvation-inducible PhoH-like protein